MSGRFERCRNLRNTEADEIRRLLFLVLNPNEGFSGNPFSGVDGSLIRRTGNPSVPPLCSVKHCHITQTEEKKELSMAKKKAGKSFSQSIREHLQANPNATPNQIVAALAKTGVNVSVGLASNVKYTSGPGAKTKTAKKKRTTGQKTKTVKRKLPSAQNIDISALQAAAKFVADVGDADKAIAAVKQVSSLQIQ